MFLASGYTLAETAHLLSVSDIRASDPPQHYEKAACEKRSAILKIHPRTSELSAKLDGVSLPNFY